MPTYTFALRDGGAPIEDGTGVGLPDRAQALGYAHQVAHELMRCREPKTRSWRLDVFEEGEPIYEIPFARIDSTLDGLNPQLRGSLEQVCDSLRSLRETVHASRVAVRESKALVARSRGRPYLATDGGERTIRAR
jgi:hypothetical protein